jgi:hypothetical protein
MKKFYRLLLIILLPIYACDKNSEIIETILPPKNGLQIPPWEPEYYNVNILSLHNPTLDDVKVAKYALSYRNWYSEKKNSSVILNIAGVSYDFNINEIKESGILTASYKDETDVIKIRKDSLGDLFQKEEDFKIQYHVNNPANTLLNYDTLVVYDKIICFGGNGDYNNVLSFNMSLKHKNPIFLISFENIDKNGASISINGLDEWDKSFYRHTDEGMLYYEYMLSNQKTNDFKLKLFRTYREDEGLTLLETIPTTTGDTTTQISFNKETFIVKVSIRNSNYNRIIVTRANVPIDGVNQELKDWDDGGDGTFIFDL